MENLTLGEIAKALAFIVAFISSATALFVVFKRGMSGMIKSTLAPEFTKIHSAIDANTKETKETRKESCQNFLIQCFSTLRAGGELDDITKIRVHETFSVYSAKGGNGYVHREYEHWCDEGKL